MKTKRAPIGMMNAAIRLTMPLYLIKAIDALRDENESRLNFIRKACKEETERRLGSRKFTEAAE